MIRPNEFRTRRVDLISGRQLALLPSVIDERLYGLTPAASMRRRRGDPCSRCPGDNNRQVGGAAAAAATTMTTTTTTMCNISRQQCETAPRRAAPRRAGASRHILLTTLYYVDRIERPAARRPTAARPGFDRSAQTGPSVSAHRPGLPPPPPLHLRATAATAVNIY